jgi:hypothetical protein
LGAEDKCTARALRAAGRERAVEFILLFENFEVDVCAKRSPGSLLQTHPSCPDLIRASINLRNNFFRRDGSPGQVPGDDGLNSYDGFCEERSDPLARNDGYN